MSRQHHAKALSRGWIPVVGLALVVALAVALIAGLRLVRAQVQGGQSVGFTGTIRDSIGAPPPAFSTVKLVIGAPAPGGPPPPYCAVSASDALGNYRLVLQPLSPLCAVPGTVLSLRVNDVPAVQTTVVPSLPGIYTVNFTLAIPLGGQPIVTATPVQPVLQPPVSPTPQPSPIVALQPTSQPSATVAAQVVPATRTIQLNTGCTQVIISSGSGTTAQQLASGLGNPAALSAIWSFDNSLQRFSGYFNNPSAPSDLVSLRPLDSVFICVSSPTPLTLAA